MLARDLAFALFIISILIERSKNTFNPQKEFWQILNPRKKQFLNYLIETVPIFFYSFLILISFLIYLKNPQAFYSHPSNIKIMGLLLFISGMYIRRNAVHSLGCSWTVFVAPKADQLITDNGLYRYLRHPYYVGSSLEFFGLLVFMWGLTIAVIPGLIQGFGYYLRSRREDDLLEKKFPENFKSYRKKVPAYFPFFVIKQATIPR